MLKYLPVTSSVIFVLTFVVQSVHLMRFILSTFSHDEEIQTIHLPVIFAGVIDLLYVCCAGHTPFRFLTFSKSEIVANTSRAASVSVCEVLGLLEDMLQQIPKSGLMRRPETDGTLGIGQCPFEFACAFYKITTKSLITTDLTMSTTPFASCFNTLVFMSILYAEQLCDEKVHGSVLREPFCRTLALINRFVAQLTAPIDVSWNPDTWLNQLLSTLQSEVRISTRCTL